LYDLWRKFDVLTCIFSTIGIIIAVVDVSLSKF